jgi:adenine-specific DNA-methyltransferase
MRDRARQLRKEQTPAEARLWRQLRDRQFTGFKFRRQRVIGPYIADFVCLEQYLIIELDGGQHQEQRAYDERRTLFLETEGFRVLRFWNHQVLGESQAVLGAIHQALSTEPGRRVPLARRRERGQG